jgi:arabinogalactan endo-1,4-beta-galactosidase
MKKMHIKLTATIMLIFWAFAMNSCSDDDKSFDQEFPNAPVDFYMGVDLSYVNQIMDHGGEYKDDGEQKTPYEIFNDRGANTVRLRLWHNPTWTKDVYGASGSQLYSDLKDVELAIQRSREQEMEVLLDFHYSDIWADPGHQDIPDAWKNITSLDVLEDSVYNYTHKVLSYLESKDLLPNLVQIGNETNCGMMYTNALAGFPHLNGCNGNWENLGRVFNSAIRAVRDVTENTEIETKIIIHVADPVNVQYFFGHLTNEGDVTDFEMIGFSYYPLWHTGVSLDNLSTKIAEFKSTFDKDVVILETAYPWTTEGDDSYNNLFGGQTPIAGYSFSVGGQLNIMKKITQEVHDGGGKGVMYWEPAWISSGAKDLWGTGSAWENSTFFDFNGNAIESINYLNAEYEQ